MQTWTCLTLFFFLASSIVGLLLFGGLGGKDFNIFHLRLVSDGAKADKASVVLPSGAPTTPPPEQKQQQQQQQQTGRQQTGRQQPPPAPASHAAENQSTGDMSCPERLQSDCAETGERKAVAIYLVGLRKRLLFNATVENVIAPIAKEGFAVHVYMSLVDKGNGVSFIASRKKGHEDPSLAGLSHAQLRGRLQAVVQAAGGCLVCLKIATASESLPPIPRGNPYDKRMFQYPPWKNETGRNILRVWKAREALWNLTLSYEGQLHMKYSFLLWTRDDTYWLKSIVSVNRLLATPSSDNMLWSKDCKEWSGINDKILLFGRTAATPMLTAYSTFFKRFPEYRTWNAEKYLQRVAANSDVVQKHLHFPSIPGTDGILHGEPGNESVCIMRTYWCPYLSAKAWNQSFCEIVLRAEQPAG